MAWFICLLLRIGVCPFVFEDIPPGAATRKGSFGNAFCVSTINATERVSEKTGAVSVPHLVYE